MFRTTGTPGRDFIPASDSIRTGSSVAVVVNDPALGSSCVWETVRTDWSACTPPVKPLHLRVRALRLRVTGGEGSPSLLVRRTAFATFRRVVRSSAWYPTSRSPSDSLWWGSRRSSRGAAGVALCDSVSCRGATPRESREAPSGASGFAFRGPVPFRCSSSRAPSPRRPLQANFAADQVFANPANHRSERRGSDMVTRSPFVPRPNRRVQS